VVALNTKHEFSIDNFLVGLGAASFYHHQSKIDLNSLLQATYG
jgi:hypothetical protein